LELVGCGGHDFMGGLHRCRGGFGGAGLVGTGFIGADLVGAGSEPAPTETAMTIIPCIRLGTTTAVCRNVSNRCTIFGNPYRFL
jgi:hypothetical protein